jgi:hypothetical protein
LSATADVPCEGSLPKTSRQGTTMSSNKLEVSQRGHQVASATAGWIISWGRRKQVIHT